MKKTERYPLEAGPLFRLGRAVDLAAVLGLQPKELGNLIIKRVAYYNFREVEINRKQRSLAVPINEMRRIHDRMKLLLERIELPNYLYSPRRNRAPVDNAGAHFGAATIVKLDIKQFYPSTTDEHVFQFFKHRVQMIDDIAGRLTKLCTINGKVPFGSPLSPILCALAHNDVFSKVAAKCNLYDDTMTLWVDDMTISGTDVPKMLVRDIRRLLASKRLNSHKAQRVSGRAGAVITGTYVHPGGLAPANKLHLKTKSKLEELQSSKSDDARLAGVRSLIGLTNYFLTIYAAGSSPHARAKARLAWLHNARRELETSISTGSSCRIDWSDAVVESDTSAPWE